MLALKRKGVSLDPNYRRGFLPQAKLRCMLERMQSSPPAPPSAEVKSMSSRRSRSSPTQVVRTKGLPQAGVYWSWVAWNVGYCNWAQVAMIHVRCDLGHSFLRPCRVPDPLSEHPSRAHIYPDPVSLRYGCAEGESPASDQEGDPTGSVLRPNATTAPCAGGSPSSAACVCPRPKSHGGTEASYLCSRKVAVRKPEGSDVAGCIAQDAHLDNEHVLRGLLRHGECRQHHGELCQVCCGPNM